MALILLQRRMKKSAISKTAGFEKLLAHDKELSVLRAEYAQQPKSKRRAATEYVYDESLATAMFGTAVALFEAKEMQRPQWPPGFAALAIDPDYAPALLTVGCHEYASGRRSEAMDLLLRLTQLPPETPDWIEIIDKAGQFLVDAKAPAETCRLYEEALKSRPDEQEFIIGMSWALCRAGKQAQALPWMEKALANTPENSSVLNDYGWALTELRRFEEAEPILEKAVQLALPGDTLPSNNLERMRQLRAQSGQSGKASPTTNR